MFFVARACISKKIEQFVNGHEHNAGYALAEQLEINLLFSARYVSFQPRFPFVYIAFLSLSHIAKSGHIYVCIFVVADWLIYILRRSMNRPRSKECFQKSKHCS